MDGPDAIPNQDTSTHDAEEPGGSTRGLRERGASAVEYALVLALVVGTTLLAIESLTDESGQYLSSTGDDIGEPREMIADIDRDLPDPPVWAN